MLVHITGPGKMQVIIMGFIPEATMMAREAYGPGMLITEPTKGRIHRLLPDGTISLFMELKEPGRSGFCEGLPGPSSGPDEMVFLSPDEILLISGVSGLLQEIAPDGTASTFATLPLPDSFLTGPRSGSRGSRSDIARSGCRPQTRVYAGGAGRARCRE